MINIKTIAAVFLTFVLVSFGSAFAQEDEPAQTDPPTAGRAEQNAQDESSDVDDGAVERDEQETRPQAASGGRASDEEAGEDGLAGDDDGADEAPAGLPTRPRGTPAGGVLADDGEARDDENQSGVLTDDDEETRQVTRRKISIDAVVVVNYSFSGGGDAYSVKYHISLGGDVNADVGVIKGNAKVATDISGFLAKSSMFECVLKVSIADVPYEVYFKKVSDNEADLTVSFKGQIMEDWESLCTFLDNSGAKFNTRGAPERWIGSALEKAKPPMNKLNTPLDNGKTTTQKFIIQSHVINDELGSAKIEGTGVVTIENRVPPRVDTEIPPTAVNSKLPPTVENMRRTLRR